MAKRALDELKSLKAQSLPIVRRVDVNQLTENDRDSDLVLNLSGLWPTLGMLINKFEIKLIPKLKEVFLQTEQFETSRSKALL